MEQENNRQTDLGIGHDPSERSSGVGVLAERASQWYEFGMKGVAKVAVSIPVETLRSLERVRKKARRTRSAAVTEAIERWLAAEEMGEADRRYVEGYLRQPEHADEQASLAKAALQTWEKWE